MEPHLGLHRTGIPLLITISVISLPIITGREGGRSVSRQLSISPHSAGMENSLGNALIECGRPDAAIPHLKKAIAIDPEFASAYGNLGIALVRCGLDEAGIDQLRKAIAMGPRHATRICACRGIVTQG